MKSRSHILFLSLLLTILNITSMDLPQQTTSVRPTIKAIIYINPDRPYAHLNTAQQQIHTSMTGIKSFEEDLMLPVAVLVQEQNGTIINWTQRIPNIVRNYERNLLKQPMSFSKQLHTRLAIENFRFPLSIPARLAYNCANGSTGTFIIHGFPVEAIYRGYPDDFINNYQNAMIHFYHNPEIGISEAQKNEFVAKGLLIRHDIPSCNSIFCLCKKTYYTPGKIVIQSITTHTIKPYGATIFEYLKNREYGKKLRHPKPIAPIIHNEKQKNALEQSNQ